MSGHLLYAYLGTDREDIKAVVLDLSPHDRAAVLQIPARPGAGWVSVQDRPSGRWWAVRPAPCEADCHCALEAHPLTTALRRCPIDGGTR